MSKPVFFNTKNETIELRFSARTMKKIETRLGKKISAVEDSVIDMEAMLEYGLIKKDINEDMVFDMMDEVGLKYCATKISEALNEAVKGNEEQKNLDKVV